jgi:hypothetical protein
MIRLAQCSQCNRNFPDHLVQPPVANEAGMALLKGSLSVPCCPICWDKWTHESMPQLRNTGPRFARLLEEAKQWVKEVAA